MVFDPTWLIAAEAEAPQMAEGAYTVAIVGGIIAILTAGIPVLFLSGKDKQDDAKTKMENLEKGLAETEFEGMEVIDEPADGSQKGTI